MTVGESVRCGLEEVGEDGGSDDGEQAAYYDGEAAHCSLNLPDFHGFGSPYGMGTGTNCNAFGYRLLNFE